MICSRIWRSQHPERYARAFIGDIGARANGHASDAPLLASNSISLDLSACSSSDLDFFACVPSADFQSWSPAGNALCPDRVESARRPSLAKPASCPQDSCSSRLSPSICFLTCSVGGHRPGTGPGQVSGL